MAPLRQAAVQRQSRQAQGQGEADVQPCILPDPRIRDAVHAVFRQIEEDIGDLGNDRRHQDSFEVAGRVPGVEETLGHAEEENGRGQAADQHKVKWQAVQKPVGRGVMAGGPEPVRQGGEHPVQGEDANHMVKGHAEDCQNFQLFVIHGSTSFCKEDNT